MGILISLVLLMAPPLQAQEEDPEGAANDEFLDLGTEKGIGGKDWMKFDREQIKYQIEQFIPPLLQPAFTQSAFVLPPHAIRISVAPKMINLEGNDFFEDRESNRDVFRHFSVDRQFYDFNLLYGFDLNRKYLHSFTLKLNLPFISSQTKGRINPNGISLLNAFNEGSDLGIGDLGIFLKKKIKDQGNFPFGIAMVSSIFLPTGESDQKFVNGGKVQFTRPDISGKLGFVNGNVAPPPIGMPLPVGPAADFPAGTGAFPGLANLPIVSTPFPFNGGVFNRFSDDGRLPSPLQPGTGSVSYAVGLFVTRQFLQGDYVAGREGLLSRSFRDLERWPGRSAFHLGALHRFNSRHDGVDPGDKTTFFASFVKPIFRDYLAMDLTFVGFHQQADKYSGTFIQPRKTMADFGAGLEPAIIFEQVERKSFVKGVSGFFAPSLIYSPDPQIRFTLSTLIRVIEPERGPTPDSVFRAGFSVTF